jgi:hypothetical protein
MVILKGLKKVPKVKVPEDIFLTVSMKGSMKEELMKEWIEKCYNRRTNFFNFKVLFNNGQLWDA